MAELRKVIRNCDEGGREIEDLSTEGGFFDCGGKRSSLIEVGRDHPYAIGDALEPAPKRRAQERGISHELKQEVGEALQKLILTEFPSDRSVLENSISGINILKPLIYDSNAKRAVIETAWSIASSTWNQKTFKEIIIERSRTPETFVKNSKKPLYSVHFSYWLILSLLKEQLGQEDLLSDFLKFIPQWFDGLSGTLNTIFIKGGTGSGKSFFQDTISNLVWNVGRVDSQLNKWSNNFIFDNLFNRRLIYWSEIVFDSGYTEQMLKITGCEVSKADKKYAEKQELPLAPVLCCANKDPFRSTFISAIHQQAFARRVHTMQWSSLPILANFTALPHPLVWQKLINYNSADWDLIPDLNALAFVESTTYLGLPSRLPAPEPVIAVDNFNLLIKELNESSNLI